MGWSIRAKLAVITSICVFQALGCVTNSRESEASRLFLNPPEAAQAELDILRNLGHTPADSDSIQAGILLGFGSVDEMAAAQLGSPFRICSAPLELLEQYQTGNDPNELLVDSGRMLFPILVNGRARSSLTVEKSEGKIKSWRVTQRGSPRFMRLIQNAFPTLISPIHTQDPMSSTFLVWIMGLRFLGDRKNGQLFLTPIEEIDRPLKLKVGEQQAAPAFFDTLAKHINLRQYGEYYRKYLEELGVGQGMEPSLTKGGHKC
jgi:hypothetical protein